MLINSNKCWSITLCSEEEEKLNKEAFSLMDSLYGSPVNGRFRMLARRIHVCRYFTAENREGLACWINSILSFGREGGKNLCPLFYADLNIGGVRCKQTEADLNSLRQQLYWFLPILQEFPQTPRLLSGTIKSGFMGLSSLCLLWLHKNSGLIHCFSPPSILAGNFPTGGFTEFLHTHTPPPKKNY